MAERLAKSSDIGTYKLYHFNALIADQQVTEGTHGDFIGRLTINTSGTGIIITLGNGTTNTASNIFARVTSPATAPNFEYEGVCDKGLYISIAGTTAGDYTISALPMAI